MVIVTALCHRTYCEKIDIHLQMNSHAPVRVTLTKLVKGINKELVKEVLDKNFLQVKLK